VDKRLLTALDNHDSATREAIKAALEETAEQALDSEPVALLALLRLAAERGGEKGAFLTVLLEDNSARITGASARLRFSLTMLGVFLLVG
jgi:hypothetical protein